MKLMKEFHCFLCDKLLAEWVWNLMCTSWMKLYSYDPFTLWIIFEQDATILNGVSKSLPFFSVGQQIVCLFWTEESEAVLVWPYYQPETVLNGVSEILPSFYMKTSMVCLKEYGPWCVRCDWSEWSNTGVSILLPSSVNE